GLASGLSHRSRDALVDRYAAPWRSRAHPPVSRRARQHHLPRDHQVGLNPPCPLRKSNSASVIRSMDATLDLMSHSSPAISEVLKDMEGAVAELLAMHTSKAESWWPSEMLPRPYRPEDARRLSQ